MGAVDDLRRAGATIIDPGVVEGIGGIRRQQGVGPCTGFKYDINRVKASRGCSGLLDDIVTGHLDWSDEGYSY